MSRNYNIGLDIGTSSIGWAITDPTTNRILKVKQKTGMGTRLFKEGYAAADRRSFRTTRRRFSRRKWRLRLLREIFEPYISEIDPNFFMRLKQSNVSPKDERKKFKGDILFNNRTDYEFYHEYPTMYHLRKKLMTEDRKFDLREIYLAMHHIVKYRGHFLNETPTSKFDGSKLDLMESFTALNELYTKISAETMFELRTDNLAEVKKILINKRHSANDRMKELASQVLIAVDDKKQNSANTKQVKEFLKAVLGMNFQLNVVVGVPDEIIEDKKEWKLRLSNEDADDTIEKLNTQLDDDRQEVMAIVQRMFSAITLALLLTDNHQKTYDNFSSAMVARYDDHCRQLKKLKTVIENHPDKKKARKLKNAYDKYIDGNDGKNFSLDEFYKEIKTNLDDSQEAQEILELISINDFVLKQRSSDNRSVPHQLHQKELEVIIQNQAKYYPWLAEKNPNKNRKNIAPFKIEELVAFRIPYYVGPLISGNENNDNAKFAWMIRKEAGNITPWNFDQKVDRMQTANKFIKRMTTTDSYLLGEDVLPKSSMLYQRFEVLNELSKVRINQQLITLKQKHYLFEHGFKQNKNMTVKKAEQLLYKQGGYESIEISGLADSSKFLSNYSTYIEMKAIFGDRVDNSKFNKKIEQAIEWSTVFEDREIYRQKLESANWFTLEETNQLARKRYKGWGKLSKRLLTEVFNSNGERMIDILWNSDFNFMQIINQPDFKQAINEMNGESLGKNSVTEIIDDLYTSPQNKKAIRQVLLVVEDIVKAMGSKPKNIMIEYARGSNTEQRQETVRRERQIEKAFTIAANEISDQVKAEFKEKTNDKNPFKDRIFLYFMQNGRDPYSGKRLNIDNLSEYDIDHIIPQSFMVDNSLDNRVLTTGDLNEKKGPHVPMEVFPEQRSLWAQWMESGLISKRKFRNLTLRPDNIGKYANQGFINRQLVETRQVIKLVGSILDDQYGDTAKIISIKAGLSSQMRLHFEFVKSRDLNDYHHAFDAYLSAFIGSYLLKEYPKLSPLFAYGEYFKGDYPKLDNFNFLSRFYSQSKKESDGQEQLGYMRKIYQYKKLLVSHEVYQNKGAMFNQTIYKAIDDNSNGKKGKNKQLIPTKKDRPTEVYGGYSGKTNAYMALVEIQKKVPVYRLYGVPMTQLANLNNTSDRQKLINALEEIVRPNFEKVGKNGKVTKTKFRIVAPKVLMGQLVVKDGVEYTLGSAAYLYNARQLVLSDEAVKAIEVLPEYTKNSTGYVDALKAVLNAGAKYFSHYDLGDYDEVVSKFEKLEKSEQFKVLHEILAGLHANAIRLDEKKIGLSAYHGRFVQTAGISFSLEDSFVYQSPTGLFERRLKIADLIN